MRFEYDCSYSQSSSKKRRVAEDSRNGPDSFTSLRTHRTPRTPRTQSSLLSPSGERASTSIYHNATRSLEANSGAAFLRRLALRLDPKDAPRLHTFAWNAFLGERRTSHPPTSQSITALLSQAEMEALMGVYLQKLDPIYGFIDRRAIQDQIKSRWTFPSEGQMQDAVLLGIAAIGCLYSKIEPTKLEADLVESARLILEQSISDIPTVTSITAWILRVSYMRIADTHHKAWMASCILMHMVEAAGLHFEPSNQSILPSSEDVDLDLRRRLVTVSQHLNIWMSFDMGRSRVTLCNAAVAMPSPRPGDYTIELMELLPFSAELDPDRAHCASDLEAALSAVINRTHTKPPSVLAQCNLALCLCRRLQSLYASFSGKILEQMLALAETGIQAAQAILDDRAPWHHMANVPFQVVCLLLAIDNHESLSRLEHAMQCLSNVAQVYNTNATREAMQTASLLVLLHKKRKEKSTAALGDILASFPVIQPGELVDEPALEISDNMQWLDDLADDSNLPFFDLNQFLVPAFLR